MSKSYLMSIVIHLGLLTAALLITPPLIEKLDQEIVVELIEPAPAPEMKASPVAVEAAAPVQATAIPEAKIAEETVAPPVKTPKVVSKPAPAPKAVKSVARAKTLVASRAVVPETLDDIETSDLDYDAVEVAPAAALNDGDLDSEFTKIDKKTNEKVLAHQSAFDNDVKNIEQETDEELAGIENENKQNSKAMAEALQATRSKNAALLAQMRAGEEAEARRAAADAAAKAAAAARAAKAQGTGSGNSSVASGNGKVRSIENLRQREGNPKPQYSMEERFRKEQGTVVFQAFVTPQGSLEQFKLMQSTGFKNLDGKTLAALKKWKFYPGQQGWVEIPQTWSLKGEAEEMPATLRRRISQR